VVSSCNPKSWPAGLSSVRATTSKRSGLAAGSTAEMPTIWTFSSWSIWSAVMPFDSIVSPPWVE
jgi:hypothetical protein